MTISQNQFTQSMVKGVLSGRPNLNSLPVQLDVTTAGNIGPATAVKVVNSAGGVPKVVEVAADTDDIMGFINYNGKDADFDAYAAMEISQDGNVMVMEASAAIARNAEVMVVVTGSKIATATSGKRIVGRTLDKAAADGDLVRVQIKILSVLKA